MLEVSEQYAIENYTLFVEALQNFTQMGFSIAVDDVGAGYSGLEKVAHLNPRYLKFDMQLVRDIDSEPRQARDGPRPQDVRRQDGLEDHRRGHRDARASGRPASSSGSTTARGTCSAAPRRSRRFSLGPAAPSSAP